MDLKITEIPFVAYPVSDMNRARDLYERILGLEPGDRDHEIKEMPGKYWVEHEIGSQTLAIQNAWEPSGQSVPSVAFEVENFQESVNLLKKEGVKILAECIETTVCRMALIEDQDGNGIMIHKDNKNALGVCLVLSTR